MKRSVDGYVYEWLHLAAWANLAPLLTRHGGAPCLMEENI